MSEKEVFKRMAGLQKVKNGEDIPISEAELGVLFEYDRMAGAIYVRFDSNEKVEKTEVVTENCNFDLDKYGGVIGIEILSAGKWIKQYLDRIING